MLTLDCESREAALASLAAVYSIPGESIEAFLHRFDIDEHYKRNNPPHPGDQETRLMLESSLGCAAAPLDRVCWFHLTRALPDANFMAGIQPLTTALWHVWEAILHVFRGTHHETRLVEMRKAGVSEFHYELKAHDAFHAGPYAMLVREVAGRSKEIGNHDYLWLPEIMEDICNGYQASYGHSLHNTLSEALSPTIVKFWSSKIRGIDCVEAALYYLYVTAHGRKITMYANTCFDGKDEAIPGEQILRVEFKDT